jgi:xylan 1,4-beta-xylosidase
MPSFTCDLSQTPVAFTHFWEHTVGSGHAPLALRADWQAQLRRAHAELGFQHVRFHGILSDQMGTLVCQNEKFLFSFFNTDRIFDFLLSIGMKPFIELSFMPEALASGNKTVFRYQGNVTPPRDYRQWEMLILKLVKHWVDRYGVAEVRQWYLEVWNEPNLHHFWTGNMDDYFKLYRHTVAAIKKVDGSLRVGGPATAQNAWIEEWLAYCESNDLPADFVTTHYYPTDAFGEIGADTETQLANAPRDVMRQRAQESRSKAGSRPLYYTEWNVSSNPRHDMHDLPSTAAYAARILMNVHGLVQGYSFWTFSDIFEENYFPSVPFHGGFGLLNIYGVAKPVYRAFQLLHQLGDQLFDVAGQHETVEVWGVRKAWAFTFLLVNQAMPGHAIQSEYVELTLVNAPQPLTAFVERIDEDHANPQKVWMEQGRPVYLSAYEVDELKAISELVKEPLTWSYDQGYVRLKVTMPPQSVAAITLEFGIEGIENMSANEREENAA